MNRFSEDGEAATRNGPTENAYEVSRSRVWLTVHANLEVALFLPFARGEFIRSRGYAGVCGGC